MLLIYNAALNNNAQVLKFTFPDFVCNSGIITVNNGVNDLDVNTLKILALNDYYNNLIANDILVLDGVLDSDPPVYDVCPDPPSPEGDYIPLDQKGAADGVVPLGSDTKIESEYLPSPLIATILFRQGTTTEYSSAIPPMEANEPYFSTSDNALIIDGELYVKLSQFQELEARVTALENP